MTPIYALASLILAGSIAVSVFFLWKIVGKLLSMWSRMETRLSELNPSGLRSANEVPDDLSDSIR